METKSSCGKLTDQIQDKLKEAQDLWASMSVELQKAAVPLAQKVHLEFDRGAIEWEDRKVLLLLTPEHDWSVSIGNEAEWIFADKEISQCIERLKSVLLGQEKED